MPESFTTMRIYKSDKQKMRSLVPGTDHVAFHTVVSTLCTHPENKRSYVMAELPLPGQEALTADSERLHVGGFYCQACKTYVFRGTPAKA